MIKMKNIHSFLLVIGAGIFLFVVVFVGSSSIKEVEIETDLKGKIIEFTQTGLYEANGRLDFDDKENTVLTSDIIPDRIVRVTQREYVEQASHIRTIDVAPGKKYEVLKKVTYEKKCSGIACLGDNVPVDKYYLKETNELKTIFSYTFERELKEKRVIIH